VIAGAAVVRGRRQELAAPERRGTASLRLGNVVAGFQVSGPRGAAPLQDTGTDTEAGAPAMGRREPGHTAFEDADMNPLQRARAIGL
jgi:hypothetical protein